MASTSPASPLLSLLLPSFEREHAPLLDGPGIEPLTYGAALDRVRVMAVRLRSWGVRPGDRVSAQVAKSPDALLLYLAVLWAGAVFHPINPASAPDEVAFLVGQAEPAVTVDDRRLTDLAEVATSDAGGTDVLEEPMARGGDDLAALLFTSGTTGRPKGAMITHGNLASNAAALHRAWGFRPDDRLLHVLPLFHAHGLFVACHTTLINGTSMRWHHRFDVDAALDDLPACTVMMGVPTHYHRLLSSPRLDRTSTAGVRLFVSGSAPLSPTDFDRFEGRTGHRILERYGMTEIQMITSNPLDGERVAGTVGFPLPGISVRVGTASREGGPAVGEVGEVEVRGPNVFAGYWKQPQQRAEDFTDDGWFRTGDLGRVDAEGRLTLVGRAKELIISGGENVYPAEVEAALRQVEDVADAAVVAMPHPDLGEAGLAVLVVDDDGLGSRPEAALEAVRTAGAIARFKVPLAAVVVDELPRNAMGKVAKPLLQERYRTEWARLVGLGGSAG